MKFVLVDKLLELESGKRVTAVKALSLAEEYLADHFPKFPVLPGVFMLEALVQASAWVVREALDFAPTVIVLKDARNVTYKSFLAPGQLLQIESVCKELTAEQSTFTARGNVDGREIVKGQLTLRHLRVSDAGATGPRAELDERLRARQRALFGLVRPQGAAAAV